jgi:peptidoglycan hydrolase-like protein with peptidoglycan-binding domain
VRWVQSTLNKILGLRLPLDGVMGPETRSAIRSFQQKQGLPVDGVVGPETERLLSAAIRGNSNGDSSSEFEAFDTELADHEWQSEVNRSSSAYIQWVQQSLNRILGLRLAVDGISGPQTRSAVRSIQQKYSLIVDGIVGPQTEQALIAAGAGYPPGGSPSYTPPASQPSISSRVQLAEQILNHGRILLWPYSPVSSSTSDGADAHNNVSDTADGRPAMRSHYENAPGGSVYLNTRMLDGMLKLARSYDMRVTSIAGGSHSATTQALLLTLTKSTGYV